MTERRAQEARPGAVHLQRMHLEEWNVWELELEGGMGGAWGPGPGTSCMPASLTWGAAVRPSSAAPPTLHFWLLLLPRLSTVCFHLCPADAQVVSPVTPTLNTVPECTPPCPMKNHLPLSGGLFSSTSAKAGRSLTPSCPYPILSISEQFSLLLRPHWMRLWSASGSQEHPHSSQAELPHVTSSELASPCFPPLVVSLSMMVVTKSL